MARTVSWATMGGAVGGFIGMLHAGFQANTPAGMTTAAFLGRHAAATGGELAGVAAIFAATDTLLTAANGPSGMNSALAGCAAGSLLGVRSGSPATAAFGCGVFGAVQGFAHVSTGGGGH